MKIQTVIQRQIKRSADGLNLVARVNAAIAANVGEDEGIATAVATADSDGADQVSRKRRAGAS